MNTKFYEIAGAGIALKGGQNQNPNRRGMPIPAPATPATPTDGLKRGA